MQRRVLLTHSVAMGMGLAWPGAHANPTDLRVAINKAGRQRMLCQRMGKAWLAMLQNVHVDEAKVVLDKSIALFERQLGELKSFASTPDIQATYAKMDATWLAYKSTLTTGKPSVPVADKLLNIDVSLLGLAHLGTQQFEAMLAKPLGKLVNIAGRQRMLSQRMAKYYLAATVPVQAVLATAEINKARVEFNAAMQVLRQATETTPMIRAELALADTQWFFFDRALHRLDTQSDRAKLMSDIFVTSENLLTVMDQVTGLYASVKT